LCALTPLTLIYVTHLKGEIPAAITHQLRLEGGKIVV
jgi:ABC-type molybdenum transport system ATPase subunit/photorepair protein PhrA